MSSFCLPYRRWSVHQILTTYSFSNIQPGPKAAKCSIAIDYPFRPTYVMCHEIILNSVKPYSKQYYFLGAQNPCYRALARPFITCASVECLPCSALYMYVYVCVRVAMNTSNGGPILIDCNTHSHRSPCDSPIENENIQIKWIVNAIQCWYDWKCALTRWFSQTVCVLFDF